MVDLQSDKHEIDRAKNVAGVIENGLRRVDWHLLNRIIDSVADPIFVKNERLEWIVVNASFCRFIGHTREELLGRTDADFFSADEAAVFNDMDRQVFASGEPVVNEEVLTSAATGKTHTIRTTKTMFRDDQGNPVLVGIFTDLTALRETQRLLESANERLRGLALTDELTDLPNRRAFREELDRTVALAARHDQEFAVIFCDLNGLKPVNDNFGHEVGDEVLCEVANRLRHQARDSDHVSRLAGDEFMLIAKNTGREGAAVMARRVAMELSRAMSVSCGDVQSGASIGVACYPADGLNHDDLVRHADQAMYHAKHVTLEPVALYADINNLSRLASADRR